MNWNWKWKCQNWKMSELEMVLIENGQIWKLSESATNHLGHKMKQEI